MKYRPDIDGLRCLAVLSVILFHLGSGFLPGGFTGVDIFFVISGFLITGIITNALQTDSFSLSYFYARRVRRIFPALFTVLFFSALFAVLALEPDMYERFFKEFRFAAVQASNFLFAKEKGYFEAGNENSPLLHTWSLGVEEQFYLIWPFLLLAAFKIWKNRVPVILLCIVVLSFICSNYLTSSAPQLAFYMLYSRAWELALGGLAATISIPDIQSKTLSNVLALTGLVLVFAGLLVINKSTPFPGRYALLPAAGTVLLLYTGSSRTTIPYQLLSWRPFVFAGMISYSLYLWHWPLIVFYKVVTGSELTTQAAFFLFAMTVALSTISYYFVEKPFRYGTVPPTMLSLYEKVVARGSISRRTSFYLLVLVAVPSLCVFLIVYSIKIEANSHAAKVVFDVQLKENRHISGGDRIVLYWKEGRSEYNEGNSSSLGYDAAHRMHDNIYHFEFDIPELHKLSGLRLDPLRDEGIVALTNISISGGLFHHSFNLDIPTIKNKAGGLSENVKISFTKKALVIESSGTDPHFVLLNNPSQILNDKMILFSLLFVLSWLFIAAMRQLKNGSEHKAVLALGCITIALWSLTAVRLQYSNLSQWRFLHNKDLNQWFAPVSYTDVSLFPKPENPDAVLLGDSHVANFAAPIRSWCEKRGLSLRVLAKPACAPLLFDGTEKGGQSLLNPKYAGCKKYNTREIRKIVAADEIQYVFLAMRQEFYYSNPELLIRTEKLREAGSTESAEDLIDTMIRTTVKTFKDARKKVVLLGQIPVLKESPKTCLSRHVTLISAFYGTKPSCDINKGFSDKKLEHGRHLFARLTQDYEGLSYIEPETYIDSIFADNNTVIYYDNNHLNHYGSESLVPFFARELAHL